MAEIVVVGHNEVTCIPSLYDHLRLVVYHQALVTIEISAQIVDYYFLLVSQLLVFSVGQSMPRNFLVHFWQMVSDAVRIQYLSDGLRVGQGQGMLRTERYQMR
jgi:hypothetical protein